MAKKTWSYSQITASTENGIAASMKLSEEARKEGDNDSARFHRNFAWGKFNAWSTLTAGWQKEGDAARLEAMTEFKKEAQ